MLKAGGHDKHNPVKLSMAETNAIPPKEKLYIKVDEATGETVLYVEGI